MGSIDPLPQSTPQQQPEPQRPAPLLPPKPTVGLAGVLGMTVGLTFFVAGALAGLNVLTMGIGIAFIAAGASAKIKPPMKLCPACRFEIPLEAGLCGHCRTEQPA